MSLLDNSYNNHIPMVFNLMLFYLMGNLIYYNAIYVELLRIIIVLLEPTAGHTIICPLHISCYVCPFGMV